jgi:hypothetical protein
MDNQGITPDELKMLLSNETGEREESKKSAGLQFFSPRSKRQRKKKWWSFFK